MLQNYTPNDSMQQSTLDLFHIPHILDEITQLLSIQDLKQCILVSHSFWLAFVPHLWRNLHFDSLERQEKNDLSLPNSPFLLTSDQTPSERREYYQCSVRSIALSVVLPFYSHPDSESPTISPYFPNLDRFKLRNQRPEIGLDAMTIINPLIFLQNHAKLTSIELSFLRISGGSVNRLKETMESLPNLNCLVLNLSGNLSLLDTQLILAMSRRLKKFHLSISPPYYYRHPERSEMEVYRQRIDVMQTANCKIKDLLIMTEFDALVLVDYLKGCSLLERLSFPELPTQPLSLVTSLAKVIQRNCSRLRHLDLISPQLSDSALSEVIVACNPSANQDNGSGLLSLNTRLCGTLMSATLDAIIGHRATLTSLSIRQGKGVTAPGLQRIVTSCVHLRWLNATVIFTDTIPIAMEEIESKPWLCRDLRTLSVCFTDHCTAVGCLPALHFLQNFYAQVGGLDSLEVLSFRMGRAGWVPMRQLFLEGLKQLFRIKTLRRFGFHKEEVAALQKQHIEAMLEQWPKLEQLAGTNYRGLKISEWLKQVRPNLDLDPLIKGL